MRLILLLFLSNTMASTPPSSPPVSVAKAISTFSLALLKELNEEDKTANIFYSPLSMVTALSMVMLGARGNTEKQMSEVLGFLQAEPVTEEAGNPAPEDPPMEQEQTQVGSLRPYLFQSHMQTRSRMSQQPSSRLPLYLQCLKSQNGKDIHAKIDELLCKIKNKKATYDLDVANRLYLEQKFSFSRGFLRDTKKYYNAELEQVDFVSKAEEVRIQINEWVEKNTQGKIKDLLVQGVVDDSTRLVLVNAIYFKDLWESKFREEDTQDAQFRISKTETKPVKMMRQKSKFLFRSIPEMNVEVLEMPYESNDLSMIILLPDDIEDDSTGLEKLVSSLDHQKFVDWTRPDMMNKSDVDVKLPRFKLEEKYDMNEILIKMGMVDAFDVSKSNFCGMSPGNKLFLSKVVHKAYVEVNEEGTEAAAATGAVMTERSAVIPTNFNADHPFLFFIRHNPTKAVLFSGRYCSPE